MLNPFFDSNIEYEITKNEFMNSSNLSRTEKKKNLKIF